MIQEFNLFLNYLRVDAEEEYQLINTLINATSNYLQLELQIILVSGQNTILDYYRDIDSIKYNLALLYMLAMTKELYDNRGLTIKDADEKCRYTLNNIRCSLQYGSV